MTRPHQLRYLFLFNAKRGSDETAIILQNVCRGEVITAPTFGCFIPLPGGCKVCAALGADEGHGLDRGLGVQVQDPRHALLEAAQVDELRVGRVRDKMHFWRRRFGWRDLKIMTPSDNLGGENPVC